ncbi:hypothetical protein HELRODRAFT_143241, partial [Helobdella robusta]|uniref:Uracil-DNA glycosylase-like domain-containing protein n=1 Tax=Helobdella robusta TaxID=6412 RepID=T1EJ96_HELRO
VEYTYNPLEYASELHCMFLERFFKAPTKLLFVGMNPGPYGMAQTGVPFGDVRSVFNWMKINGSVRVPKKQHPKKPVQGLKCTRNEVSGERFWRMFSQTLNLTPEEFFENAFVINVCPLLFLDKSGKNIALSTLPAKLRNEVELLCHELMLKTLEILQPHHVVAIGQYAHDQIKKMLKSESHLIPSNPLANKGWSDIAKKQLSEMGVL